MKFSTFLAVPMVLALATTDLRAQFATEDAVIQPADAFLWEYVGASIVGSRPSFDVDGDRLALGRPNNGAAGPNAGAVSFYERDDSGAWVETDFHSSGSANMALGAHVVLEGSTCVVSADGRNALQTYERVGPGKWRESQLIVSPTPASGFFGDAFDLMDGRLVTLTHGKENAPSAYARPARVDVLEKRPDGRFVHAAGFPLVDAAGTAMRVISIDLHRDTIAVSGDLLDYPVDPFAHPAVTLGSIWIYRRDQQGAWTLDQKVVSRYPNRRLGGVVDLDGETLAAMSAEFVAFSPVCEVEVFRRDAAGVYRYVDTFSTNESNEKARFGSSIAVAGDRIAVGAPRPYPGLPFGSAYLYERRTDGTWYRSVRHATDDGTDTGGACAIEGDTLFVASGGSNSALGSLREIDIAPLMHGSRVVGLASGGQQDLLLRAGAARRGDAYLVLGSTTGTSPGVVLAPGVELPLVVDAYTQLGLALSSPVVGAVGLLDADGNADAAFVLPSATSPAFAGVRLRHAYVALDLTTFEAFASNAVAVALVP